MFICGLALFTTSVLYFGNILNPRIAIIETISAQPGPQGPQGETGATGEVGPQGEMGPRGAQGPAGMSPTDVLQDDISWILGLAGGIILIVVSVVQGIRWLHGSITKQVKTEIDNLKNIMDSDKKLIDQRLDFQNTILAEIKSTTNETNKKIDLNTTKLEAKIDVIEEKKNIDHREIYLHLQKHDDAITHLSREINKDKEED